MLCFDPNDPHVVQNGWRLTLSDGRTIYQTAKPGQESSWLELKRRIAEFLPASILHLPCNRGDLQIVPCNNATHIWQSSRITTIVANEIKLEAITQGIGYVPKDRPDVVIIFWRAEHFGFFTEERAFDPNDMALIPV